MAERSLEIIWMLVLQMKIMFILFVNMKMTEIGSLALKHMFSMFFSLLKLLGKIYI